MVCVLVVGSVLAAGNGGAPAPPAPEHGVVFHDPAVFAGWPANGGAWHWHNGREFLVAFVTGKFEPRAGHNVVPPFANRLARTTDGGKTWAVEDPPGFYQPGRPVAALTEPIDFFADQFAMRVIAEGYQGGAGADGPCVTVSTDKGKTWAGPFALPQLIPDDVADGRTEITNRTDYVPLGRDECLLMGSARLPGKSGTDRAFAAKLVAGGRKAEFLGWLTPPDGPNRALMPATAAGMLTPGGQTLYTAVRVRKTPADVNWVDEYRSRDRGKTWELAGKVGDTGAGNGNPPALVVLRDGRRVCAYGDRARRKLYARVSGKGGEWGEEVVLREDYHPDAAGEVDFGYPRLFERRDGAVVCVYYWADRDRPTNHVAVTTWTPPAP